MSTLGSINIRVDKLPKEKFVSGKDGAVFVNLTMSVDDETRFGNNTSIYVSQTKEERDAKKNRTYLGNGRVVFNNGTIVNAEKEVKEEVAAATVESDFPF